jgi:hypothetical protein
MCVYRKNNDKKMVVLREKNGKLPQDTLETGKRIVKRALEYSFMQMETSMKGCGDLTKDMARELTGEMKQVN